MNFSLPPPFSNVPPCNCPVDPNISCHRWSSTEWMITTGLLSTFAGVVITIVTVYINKLKKKITPERLRMRTDLNTITEADSIPEILVMQR
jgi:hypothetical protein